jgi:hypothetical protein
LIETIKYCAKIFTEPDPKNKTKQKGNATIYRALLQGVGFELL